MHAEAAKIDDTEEDPDAPPIPAKGRAKGKPKPKGTAVKRRGALDVTPAVSTRPFHGDVTGNICLGESRDLVNSIDLLTDEHQQGALKWLTQDEYGELTLPYWIDRLGSERTQWLRYTLIKSQDWKPPAFAWTQIQTN